LNTNRFSNPRGDWTLIAGTDSNDWIGRNLLEQQNDRVVPVDSVFCRTSDPNDDDASLLRVLNPQRYHKYEYEYGFNHYNFGFDEFRLSQISDEITQGLSDWVVEKKYDDPATPENDNYFHKPESSTSGDAQAMVEVEYNVYDRDIDQALLVIYAKDSVWENGHWHIAPGPNNGADTNGQVRRAVDINEIYNNSADRPITDDPVRLSAYVEFPAHESDPSQQIVDIRVLVIPLKPGQTEVPTVPISNFSVPE
jgi:hypothetical protein